MSISTATARCDRRARITRLLVKWCVVPLLPVAIYGQAGPIVPVSATHRVNRDRAALGEHLFSDVRLSRSGKYSCATCHPLDRGGMDGLQLQTIVPADATPRNTPTIFNATLNASFNWDGATDALDRHTSAVVERLMGIGWAELVTRLRSTSEYRERFALVYSGDVSKENVIDAIVSYERTLVTPDAPFDRYLAGDAPALSSGAVEGYRRFRAYGCASCHQGVNVGGNLYARFGIFETVRLLAPLTDDPGRFRITQNPRDTHVFRVPSLRNVEVTAPYFHDGRAAKLDDAVRVMGRHQLGRELGPDDIRFVVAFLNSLTGEYRGRPLTAAARADGGAP
jgi:cytochrome c peroxidase